MLSRWIILLEHDQGGTQKDSFVTERKSTF